MRVLLVEDLSELAATIAEYLETHFYSIDLAPDGTTADELMTVHEYDLVLLDLQIPEPDGLELLRRWRQAGKDVPVLILTVLGDLDDKLEGLDTGADDYLTKPFALEELLARCRALLRRRERYLGPLKAGDLVMDRPRRRVTVGGELISLPPKEFSVLELLLRQPGEVVSREQLVEHAWDDSFDPLSNVVDVAIYRLRRKIDAGRSRHLLETVKGVGYRLRRERK